jgi:hypothetical protein
MADTSPIIYDAETGLPIDNITVEATPLPDWARFILVSIAAYLLNKVLDRYL